MQKEGVEASTFDSSTFWNNHYGHGGNSGTGSYNQLAKFKSDTVNSLLNKYAIESVIEFGCGDGNVLSMINYKNYTGVDVSPVIIDTLKKRFQGDLHKTFYTTTQKDLYLSKSYDMSLSMDVIFHLVEDDIFENYMQDLFKAPTKYVVIYSSNYNEITRWPEYKHRNFTGYIEQSYPNWKLIHFIPNIYPYIVGKESTTSPSDFYIFQKELH